MKITVEVKEGKLNVVLGEKVSPLEAINMLAKSIQVVLTSPQKEDEKPERIESN